LQKKMSSSENLRRRRFGDLKRVLRHRYRYELSPDDAGREDLELLLDVVSFAPNARDRMKCVIETWAPWMDTAESYELVENVLRKPEYLRKLKAADLGARLNLTWKERETLAIRTIQVARMRTIGVNISPYPLAVRFRGYIFCRQELDRDKGRH
jgi:hypothetical protein